MKRLLLFLLLAFASQVLAVGPVITTDCTATWNANPAIEEIQFYRVYGDGEDDGTFVQGPDIVGTSATCVNDLTFLNAVVLDGQKWLYLTAHSATLESPPSAIVGFCFSTTGVDICVPPPPPDPTAPQGIDITGQ